MKETERQKKFKAASKRIFEKHAGTMKKLAKSEREEISMRPSPAETYRKRIEGVFPDAIVTQYRESTVAKHFLEFVLVSQGYYVLKYQQLATLARLVGSTDIHVAGWVDGACEHTAPSVLGNPTVYVLVTNPRL